MLSLYFLDFGVATRLQAVCRSDVPQSVCCLADVLAYFAGAAVSPIRIVQLGAAHARTSSVYRVIAVDTGAASVVQTVVD